MCALKIRLGFRRDFRFVPDALKLVLKAFGKAGF
jgi:hypothetical protein